MIGLSVSLKKKLSGFDLDVSWEIDNELAVLFGYSGAGKSLTFQMIAGLMMPDTGRIVLNGKILFDSVQNICTPPQKRSIGYVFQDLALFPHITVRKNIAYGVKGISSTETRKKTDEMIDIFHLNGLEDKFPSEISGGQKQRVACARALIGKPGILLLDEPFSALDNPIRLEMRHLLKNIRKKFDIPVVLITHDIFEAISMADKMIVYSCGRIIQTGTPSHIMNVPVNQEVEKLVSIREFYKFLYN